MTTLPAYARSDFQKATAADLLSLWDDCGCDAIYRVQGQGAGVLVRAYVSEKPPVLVRPAVHQAAGMATGVQRKLWACCLIMEPGTAYSVEGQSGGVGADGGVANLSRGDTLEVAGVVAAKPGENSVLLKVGGEVPRQINGVQWVAEVIP